MTTKTVKNFVTGGAGFIGSNLVDALLEANEEVVAYDNLTTGCMDFLADAAKCPRFSLVKGDVLDLDALTRAMQGADRVWHLSANADVRFGLEHPRRDLEQNTIATHNVLEAMRANGVPELAFSSTGSVYGDCAVFPTPEDAPFPLQTSLYAASKLACESLIQAYCEGFGIRGRIFRFVSVLGERYTHGHVFDFCRSLLEDPARLRILGDGQQKKSYMYIADCVRGLRLGMKRCPAQCAVYNLGVDGYVTVDESAGVICEALGVAPELEHTGGRQGWVGDNPLIWLDTKKIASLGWRPHCAIPDAIRKTVAWLLANRWVFARRGS